MDRKPKPVAAAASATPAATADASTNGPAQTVPTSEAADASPETATGAVGTELAAETVLVNDAPSHMPLPQPELAAAAVAPPVVQEPVPLATEEPAAPAEPADLAPAGDVTPAENKPAEEAIIEVWRTAGRVARGAHPPRRQQRAHEAAIAGPGARVLGT